MKPIQGEVTLSCEQSLSYLTVTFIEDEIEVILKLY